MADKIFADGNIPYSSNFQNACIGSAPTDQGPTAQEQQHIATLLQVVARQLVDIIDQQRAQEAAEQQSMQEEEKAAHQLEFQQAINQAHQLHASKYANKSIIIQPSFDNAIEKKLFNEFNTKNNQTIYFNQKKNNVPLNSVFVARMDLEKQGISRSLIHEYIANVCVATEKSKESRDNQESMAKKILFDYRCNDDNTIKRSNFWYSSATPFAVRPIAKYEFDENNVLTSPNLQKSVQNLFKQRAVNYNYKLAPSQYIDAKQQEKLNKHDHKNNLLKIKELSLSVTSKKYTSLLDRIAK